VPNKVMAEAKAACNELVDDLAYRAALRKRLIAGKLAPRSSACCGGMAKANRPTAAMWTSARPSPTWS